LYNVIGNYSNNVYVAESVFHPSCSKEICKSFRNSFYSYYPQYYKTYFSTAGFEGYLLGNLLVEVFKNFDYKYPFTDITPLNFLGNFFLIFLNLIYKFNLIYNFFLLFL